MGCSARVSQNSQASRATFSSGSWVRCSMYWKADVWEWEYVIRWVGWEEKDKTKTNLRRNLREIWIRNIRNLRYHRASMSWVSHHIQMGFKFHVFTRKCGVRVLLLPPVCSTAGYLVVLTLTWMMLCMWGMSRSMRTSSSMTRARHTFFLTSESSSAASANRL